MFGWKLARANQRDGKGAGLGRETSGGGQGPFYLSGVFFLGAGHNDYSVYDGFLLYLSTCKSGFHDLLGVRPSSLLMLCGYISNSMASLISRSMYPVFAARSFVSCIRRLLKKDKKSLSSNCTNISWSLKHLSLFLMSWHCDMCDSQREIFVISNSL